MGSPRTSCLKENGVLDAQRCVPKSVGSHVADARILWLRARRVRGSIGQPTSPCRQIDRRRISVADGVNREGETMTVGQGTQAAYRLLGSSELTHQDEPDRAPYLLSISRQDAADKSLRKLTIPLSHGEAAVLETALRTAVTRLLGW